MDRRAFLKHASLAALVAGLPLPALSALAAGPDDGATAFAAAFETKPWLVGWAGCDQDAEVPRPVIEGRLPTGLAGTHYRNGPARHQFGDLRYRHWFDADGMVHAWRIADGAAGYRARFVRTDKVRREQAAGRPLVAAFGTVPDGAQPITSPDSINPANINALVHGGRLLALWEAGSAHDLDPVTLETRGIVTWRDDLKGMPFSAHPKVDPDGTLWNFGSSHRDGRLIAYRVNPNGALHSAAVVPGVLHPGMMHDFVVTERHLIFALTPMMLDDRRFSAGQSFLDSLDWRPELGLRVVVVAKDDFSRQRHYQLPAGFGFHFGNAWEEADGTIRFDFCLSRDASLLTESLRRVMRGDWAPAAHPVEVLVTLRPGGDAAVEPLGPETAEFPRVDPRVVGLRNRQLYHLARTRDRDAPLFNAVVRRDLETGDVDRFDYGDHTLVEEHVFVPRPGGTGETDGWVVGTALDFRRGATGLNVFDARRLGDGPLARAWLPFAVPLGFHGNFQPA